MVTLLGDDAKIDNKPPANIKVEHPKTQSNCMKNKLKDKRG